MLWLLGPAETRQIRNQARSTVTAGRMLSQGQASMAFENVDHLHDVVLWKSLNGYASIGSNLPQRCVLPETLKRSFLLVLPCDDEQRFLCPAAQQSHEG